MQECTIIVGTTVLIVAHKYGIYVLLCNGNGIPPYNI